MYPHRQQKRSHTMQEVRIDEILQQIETQGGEIAKVPYPEGNLWVATFRDPAGNVIGLWHEGAR